MAREATGSIRWRGKSCQFRIMLAGDHISVPIAYRTVEQAERRGALLTEIARRLHAAGHADKAREAIRQAAKSDAPEEEILDAVDLVCSGAVEVSTGGPSGTFGWLAERWTSGQLAREFPDYVKRIDHRANISRIKTHLAKPVGDVPLARFTREHWHLVMKGVDAERSVATRRHVAQIMHVLMRLAVEPLGLIATNPIAAMPLPKLESAGKAKGYLYPDEDARLLACKDVPLAWRVLYGFLHREGCRRSEALRLSWREFDLQRGTVRLDVNKTDDPRMWALSASTVAGMRVWQNIAAPESPSEPVFLDENLEPMVDVDKHFAARFRTHLKAARIDRPELFERSAHRQPIRLHDTRATFITVSLANGARESWVQDRTGHKSSVMINRYRRAARTLDELNLTMREFLPLDEAIPELRDAGGRKLRLVR